MHEDFNHKLLYDTIIMKDNWIITYNNCDFIKNLYKNYIIIDVDWKYGMNKNKQSSEIIILSKLSLNL
jgi:DNA adenine methylase